MFCGETSYPKRGTDCHLQSRVTVREELNFYTQKNTLRSGDLSGKNQQQLLLLKLKNVFT
jgi:hypothetical protein